MGTAQIQRILSSTVLVALCFGCTSKYNDSGQQVAKELCQCIHQDIGIYKSDSLYGFAIAKCIDSMRKKYPTFRLYFDERDSDGVLTERSLNIQENVRSFGEEFKTYEAKYCQLYGKKLRVEK